ncbi:MAG: IS4 family transposase [Paludibacter sp.]|nr:IS4 family transposase [Paludibacter sp.]
MGLINKNKNTNKPLLKQIIDLIPREIISGGIQKFKSDKHYRAYKTYDQLVAILYGQLNKCLSLRDITLGLGLNTKLLSDLDLSQSPARSTMSDGNENRSWKVFEFIYFSLVQHYSNVFLRTPNYKVIKEIEHRAVKLVDSSTISLCLSLFKWAKFRTAKGGIKIHTCLDEATMIPEMINITEAKVHDRRGVKEFVFDKGTIIVEDRGYFDFSLFKARIDNENYFVTRIKDNTVYETTVELDLPDGKDENILKDEIIRLTSIKAIESGMDKEKLRRVVVYKEDENKTIEIICNNLDWSSATIAELYKRRWNIETFFKLLKQNLQVKTFLGTSENACKSQIFISLIAYFLLELIRRTISKVEHSFSNFVNLIRICLIHYHSLKYIVNEILPITQKVNKSIRKIPNDELFFMY